MSRNAISAGAARKLIYLGLRRFPPEKIEDLIEEAIKTEVTFKIKNSDLSIIFSNKRWYLFYV